jgi:predicted 3-demethylubiquinone-9 3-methyltransferase (glyoxalase superfamily)
MPDIVTSLWFDTEAYEAAEFYCSLFPNSQITNVMRYTEAGPGEPGTVVTVDFVLDGRRFNGINGGPAFTFSEAISLLVPCADQAEADRLWDALLDGGQPSQCGWLKDRYGLSWQIVPNGLDELLGDPDPGRARRATEAMLQQSKLDLAAIRAAADAE